MFPYAVTVHLCLDILSVISYQLSVIREQGVGSREKRAEEAPGC
ncbi:hypothetical protein [Scytonema millei]